MLAIKEEASLDAADTQRVYDGLLATDPLGQPRRYAPLVVSLRDEDSQLRGAVLASTVWNWLSIDALWVDPRLRRLGHGRRLIVHAERLARGRGCTRARLDTFDFQARMFYERLGYSVYAELDDFPVGHVQFHMQKTFAPAS
jgi:N-acylglucosamine-6-phosphate 2-epimerase